IVSYPRRLFRQSGHHSFRRLRFVSDQIHGGNDQRQIVVDVVTHRRELLVQLPKLFYGQCDWLTRQSHFQRWSKTIPQIKSAAANARILKRPHWWTGAAQGTPTLTANSS